MKDEADFPNVLELGHGFEVPVSQEQPANQVLEQQQQKQETPPVQPMELPIH